MAEPEKMTQMQADMKTAMKAKDTTRLGTLRMLLSALKNKRIELGHDLSDDDVVTVLSTEAKKRREAADAYREGKRDELADKEEAELAVIEDYLPAQLSDADVEQMVDEIIEKTGAETKRDMGKVMGQLMPQLKGRFDGGRAKDIVMGKLA